MTPAARRTADLIALVSLKHVNGRTEPAKKCYQCGSTKTKRIDNETNACRVCGTEYALEYMAVLQGNKARYPDLGPSGSRAFFSTNRAVAKEQALTFARSHGILPHGTSARRSRRARARA